MTSRWALAPLLYLLVASTAFAQDDAAVTAAYEHAAQALNAFEQGRNTEALDEFSRAHALVKLPSFAAYMARANVKLGHYLAAAALYDEATRLEDGPGEHEAQQNAREEAQREGQALLARIPRLVVQTPGIPIQLAAIQVDGIAIASTALAEGWRVDPGVHRVTAQTGDQKLEQTEPVSEGVTKTVVFVFQPAKTSNGRQMQPKQPDQYPPESGTNAFRNATWVSFGIGGTALAFWGVTGLIAVEEKPAEWNCATTSSAYCRWRTLSTIGFYTGLVGVGTGTVLLLATPSAPTRHQSGAQVRPWVGVGSAGVSGQF